MPHAPIASQVRPLAFVLALALAGASALLVSSRPVEARAGEDERALAEALAQRDEEWSNAAATRDAEKVAAFYAEDAIAYPPNQPVAVGRAAAKKVWAASFADPSFHISWRTAQTEVARSGELGFTAGTYLALYKNADGAMVREPGKFLCAWKKGPDGSWMAVHDMWNADSK